MLIVANTDESIWVARLQRVAAVGEKRGLAVEHDDDPGRAGEAGQPGQPLLGGRHVFVLMPVGSRQDQAGQAAAGQFGSQRLHAGPGLCRQGVVERLETGLEHARPIYGRGRGRANGDLLRRNTKMRRRSDRGPDALRSENGINLVIVDELAGEPCDLRSPQRRPNQSMLHRRRDGQERGSADGLSSKRSAPMSMVSFAIAVFHRFMAARQRSAELELARHGLRLPRELEDAGLKVSGATRTRCPSCAEAWSRQCALGRRLAIGGRTLSVLF